MNDMQRNGDPRFTKFTSKVETQSVDVEVAREESGFRVKLGGRERQVEWQTLGGDRVLLSVDGAATTLRLSRTGLGKYLVDWKGRQVVLEVEDELAARASKAHAAARGAGGPVKVNAPMPGTVVQVLVHENDEVAAGQAILIIEAMKMQNEIAAPAAGKVQKLTVKPGMAVEARQPLCVIAPPSGAA